MYASRCGRRHWPVSPSLWCVRFTCKAGVLCRGLAPSALEPFAFERLPEVKPFAAEFKSLVKDLCAAGERSLVLAGPAASVEPTPHA